MTALPLIGLFGLGLLFGSFLSVLITRLHTGKPGILTGRSQCPKCGKKLGILELIPLFSYLFQGGRCRKCKKTIGWHYPVLELSTGALFAGMAFAGFDPLPLTLFYGLVLIFIFFYDLLYLEIPDEVMMPAIAIAFMASFLPQTPTWIDAVQGAGALVTFFLLQIVVSKGKWLGGGDLRIGAFMGLMLGLTQGLLALFIGYLIGAVVSVFLLLMGWADRKTMVPFGPFLVLGTLITLWYGPELLTAYLNFIGL